MVAIRDDAISSWEEFETHINELKGTWLFRGQSWNWPLESSLRRAADAFCIAGKQVVLLEDALVRDFRRHYTGPDLSTALRSKLYCLALMQHHSAPTRFIDCTYSPYIALFFAVEKSLYHDEFVVWCFDGKWLNETLQAHVGHDMFAKMNTDADRVDGTYDQLYFRPDPQPFVAYESPFSFNRRFIDQQGTFLCPGDVSIPFAQLLGALPGLDTGVVRLRFNLTLQEYYRFTIKLFRMTLTANSIYADGDALGKTLRMKIPVFTGLDVGPQERLQVPWGLQT